MELGSQKRTVTVLFFALEPLIFSEPSVHVPSPFEAGKVSALDVAVVLVVAATAVWNCTQEAVGPSFVSLSGM